ncbi:MAG: transporter substrate-binding domain-containing protein [Deltaproteobacteria bacterium]|uniref:Transporter substrate-binding domain-containing protein n=1 Tax=Candidatus Zymogenus saltonus TaxID=2844893 RepID=A0A9D8PRF8_9DELT|nr:transporter substrate-binding domain-containing protein [Candidatus Zymogenus saltonus]
MDFEGGRINRRGGIERPSSIETGRLKLIWVAVSLLLFLSAPAPRLYAGETVDRIMKDGVVVVGIGGEVPPFSYSTGEEGDEAELISLTGFDVEIVGAILEGIAAIEEIGNIDITPRFVTVDPVELIPLVAEGEIQMAPGLAHKMGWERAIDFSVTYFKGGTGIAVKKSSSIRRLGHLKGKKIALPQGIKDDKIDTALSGVNLVPVEDLSSGFELLKGGKVVGVAGDVRELLRIISLEEKPERFILVDELVSMVPYCVGIPPEDPRWREMINFSMMKIFESGLYRKMYEKWFRRDSRTKYPIGFTMEIWPK